MDNFNFRTGTFVFQFIIWTLSILTSLSRLTLKHEKLKSMVFIPCVNADHSSYACDLRFDILNKPVSGRIFSVTISHTTLAFYVAIFLLSKSLMLEIT